MVAFSFSEQLKRLEMRNCSSPLLKAIFCLKSPHEGKLGAGIDDFMQARAASLVLFPSHRPRKEGGELLPPSSRKLGAYRGSMSGDARNKVIWRQLPRSQLDVSYITVGTRDPSLDWY